MTDSIETPAEVFQESIQEILERAVEDGELTSDEHDQLMSRIHKDGQIDADESAVISKIFALIREGKLRIVDADREAAQRSRAAEAAPPPKKSTDN